MFLSNTVQRNNSFLIRFIYLAVYFKERYHHKYIRVAPPHKWVGESGLFLTLGSGTSSARNENLRPLLTSQCEKAVFCKIPNNGYIWMAYGKNITQGWLRRLEHYIAVQKDIRASRIFFVFGLDISQWFSRNLLSRLENCSVVPVAESFFGCIGQTLQNPALLSTTALLMIAVFRGSDNFHFLIQYLISDETIYF